MNGLSQTEYEILRLASLAPSGHNTQPWTVRITGPGKWIIGSDSKRWLPEVDPDNRELMLSIGAFLENLHLAAANMGYHAEQELLARDSEAEKIAGLTLHRDRKQPFSVDKIKQRRTIRNGLLTLPVSSSDIKHISQNNTQQIHYFSADSREGKILAQSTIEANIVQANRKPAVKELSEWIRFSDTDAKKYRNGLTPESMEINGIAGFIVRNFFDSKSVITDSFRNKTIEKVREQVASCAGWIVITSEDSKPETLINTGRIFQGMCMEAVERKIAVHPMTQVLEEKPFMNETASLLGTDSKLQFILRTGYVKKYPAPVSLRMPVSWFCTKDL